MTDGISRPLAGTDKRMLWIGLLAACAWWVLEATLHRFVFDSGTVVQQLIPRDSNELWMRSLVCVLFIAFGAYAHAVNARLNRAREKEHQLQEQLEDALTKALNGFLPICARCKKIRPGEADPETQASWQQIEIYLTQRTQVQFSHSVCPACERELYGESPDSPS